MHALIFCNYPLLAYKRRCDSPIPGFDEGWWNPILPCSGRAKQRRVVSYRQFINRIKAGCWYINESYQRLNTSGSDSSFDIPSAAVGKLL